MSKPVLGRGLGKLLGGDPIAGGNPPKTVSLSDPKSPSGLRELMKQPARPVAQNPVLPRWYLLFADGLLLLAAEGIVVKSDGFGWTQCLLCALLVLLGMILSIAGILETDG